MGTETNIRQGSIEELLTRGEPITHFFYEYQGARAVAPGLLIDTGITLWHENMYTNEVDDNSYLWDLAHSLVKTPAVTPMYSWIEWLRYKITTGVLTPAQWKKKKPFPYKGLLIAAIYLNEAKRLCDEGSAERAWHIIALAYYHLGLNSASSTGKNTTRAAQVLHAGRTEKIRAFVFDAIEIITKDGSVNSIEGAKDRVVEMLRLKRHTSPVKDWLNEFDTIVPGNTTGKTSAKQKNDVLVRIRNMLDDWALPSGPYPEIADAFSRFRKGKNAKQPASLNQRTTREDVPTEDSDCYLRLINLFESGETLTMTLTRNELDA